MVSVRWRRHTQPQRKHSSSPTRRERFTPPSSPRNRCCRFYQLVDPRRRLCQRDLHTPLVLRIRGLCYRGQGLPTSGSVALRSRYRCSTCSYRMSVAVLGGLAPDAEKGDAQDGCLLPVHQHAYCRLEADYLGPRQRRQDDDRPSTSTSPGISRIYPIRRIRSLALFESRSIVVNGSLGRKDISLNVLE